MVWTTRGRTSTVSSCTRLSREHKAKDDGAASQKQTGQELWHISEYVSPAAKPTSSHHSYDAMFWCAGAVTPSHVGK